MLNNLKMNKYIYTLKINSTEKKNEKNTTYFLKKAPELDSALQNTVKKANGIRFF